MPNPGKNPLNEELYRSFNEENNFVAIGNSLGDEFVMMNRPDLTEKYNEILMNLQSTRKPLGSAGPNAYYGSSNNLVSKNYTISEEGVKIAAEGNKILKDFVQNIIDNPPERTKDFLSYYKVIGLCLSDDFNNLEFDGESQYTHLSNFLTGAPKFKDMEPDQLKEKLGVAYQPLVNVYDSYYDFMVAEKEIIKNKKQGKENSPELIEKKIKAMDALTSAYDELLSLPQETRKKLDTKVLENDIDHMLGREKDRDRSPFRTISGMKEESKALKLGFNNEEAKQFYYLGNMKGALNRGSFLLDVEKENLEKTIKTGKAAGLVKMTEEEARSFSEINEKFKNTQYESLKTQEELNEYEETKKYVKSNIKRYKYSIAPKRMKEIEREKADNMKSLSNIDKMIKYGLEANVNDLDDKKKKFGKINKFLKEHGNTKIFGFKGTFGDYSKSQEYYRKDVDKEFERQTEIAKELKIKELKESYDKNPDLRRAIVGELFSEKINDKKRTDAKNELADYIENVELPKNSKELFSKEFQDKLNNDAKDINDYVDSKKALETADNLVNRATFTRHDLVREAIDKVMTGKSIGWFTKEDYGNILGMLNTFSKIKDERDRNLKNRQNMDDVFTYNIHGKESKGLLVDERMLNMEKKILSAMDKYLNRKNKEIDDAVAAGNTPRKNSIKRRDIMQQARDCFAEQFSRDKQLLEFKDKIRVAEGTINNYNNNKLINMDVNLNINEILQNNNVAKAKKQNKVMN